MKMELAQVVNKGMQRDYAMNTASQEFAYENKNIRITSTGNESFLSVTNEKSTTPISLVFKDPTYRNTDLETELNSPNRFNDNYQLCIVNVNKATKTRLHIQGTFPGENGIGIRHHNEIYEIDVDKSVYDKEHYLNLTKIDITEQRQDLKNKIVSQYGVNRDAIAINTGYLTIIEGYSGIYNSYDDVKDAQNNLEILSCTTCNNYLVLFTSYKDISNIHNIYRCEINLNYNAAYLNLVYTGNLNLQKDKPLECISYYESEDVQKLYWVDGINQPRVINIMELGQTSNTSNLDFVPKIEKQPVVTIEKEQNGAGLFPSGVVQYYITYYKKFNQETHTAYTSPLYYISPYDKGGEADSIQTCSFRIRITDVDPKYDYIRVYSLVRTSKNSDYVVSIVGDVNIKNSEDTYQIIDTNTNLVNVPSSDILFLGGNVIIPSTIEQKDNTLFLGNIITGSNTINDEIEELKQIFSTARNTSGVLTKKVLEFKYKVIPVKNEDNTTLYPYNPNLESNIYDTHFKLREKYRIGLQLIHETGETSQTIYIGDIINNTHYPHYMSQDVINDFSFDYDNLVKVDNHYIDNSGNIHLYDILGDKSNHTDYLCLPIVCLIEDLGDTVKDCFERIKEKGFTNYRLVMAETDYKDRSILCQGYVNPLTFRLGRRKNNECYNQESWTIRPIDRYKHLENVNKCGKNGDTLYYTKHSEIRSSLNNDSYKQECVVNEDYTNGELIASIDLVFYISITNNVVLRDFFNVYFSIIVNGKNSKGENTNVSFNGVTNNHLYYVYEEFDLATSHLKDVFLEEDVWTEDKIKQLKIYFGENLTDEVLQQYGFTVGKRIFGDGFFVSADEFKKVFDTYDVLAEDYFVPVRTNTLHYYYNNSNDSTVDVSGNYGENFYIDASKCSLNTPELESITDILNSTNNLKCRIVGKINIDRVISDQQINIEDFKNSGGAGKLYDFNYSKVLNNYDDDFGVKNFIGVNSAKDGKAYKLMMLDKEGSTISENDSESPSSSSPKATLKTKTVGNLWYASKTDYEFHWRMYAEGSVFNEYPDDDYIAYFPNCKSEDYRQKVTITDILESSFTTKKDDWGWYSDLIYHNIDLKNGGVKLWNTDLYVNGETCIKNIEDVLYNYNWAWLKTKDGVGSIVYKDKIESLINYKNPNKITTTQNQIQVKYNTSNSIFLDLESQISDISVLSGYFNTNLQDNLKPLWINTPLVTKPVFVDWLRMMYKNQTSFIYDPFKVDIVYVKKADIDESGLKNPLAINALYYIDLVGDLHEYYPNYFNYNIFKYVEFDDGETLPNTQVNIEDYIKLRMVKTPDSYEVWNPSFEAIYPLFKTNYLKSYINNYTKILEHSGYRIVYFNQGDSSAQKYYITNLNSSLRGDTLFEGSTHLTDGFIPNEYIKHYLPFNVKGIAGIDYPDINDLEITNNECIIDSSHNGINNSLWICELYKDFDDFEFLGGASENAIELNTFIPASQVCPIGSTIYGLYGDTYFKRWDNLRVYPMNEEQTNGIVDVVSLMLETHVNLDGDTRSARKRLDITNMRPSNMEGLVNPVYSLSNNVTTSNVLDDKFNVSSHPLQYWWSLPKTNLSEIDNWTHVVLTRVGELDGDKGPLNKIKRWNNYLFAFQDKGIAQINFNNQTVIGGQEGIPVEIANSGNVQGHYYITTNNGCKNKWSIVESPAGLYFIDSYNKSIMLLGNGLKSLSQLNLFQDWIEKNEHGNIWNSIRVSNKPAFKSFYDPIHSEVYFANGEHCLCYNELLQQFTSFYDYENLNYMFLLDGHIYGINYRYSSSDPIQLHKMFEGDDYCNLFGKQCEYYMQYKINKDPFVDKTWTNLEYRADIFNQGNIQSNKDYATDKILSNKTFDTLKVWNEYQSGELDLNTIRMNYLKDAKSRFRVWRTNIPRADKSETNKHGLDRIRNPWIMLELKKTNDTNKRMEFHDLVIKYVI